MDMEHEHILPDLVPTLPMSEDQLDRLVDFMEKQHDMTSSRKSNLWDCLVVELNGMPNGARKSLMVWKTTMRSMINSVRYRLDRLTTCDQTVGNLLRKSFTDRDRRIMKYCAIKASERRVATEQNAVILHYLRKYPTMLRDVQDDCQALKLVWPHDASLWTSLTGVLNVLGLPRTPKEWKKYVYNAMEAGKGGQNNRATQLERGIARIVWPHSSEGSVEEPAPTMGVAQNASNSLLKRTVLIQLDVLTHYLELYPRMWSISDCTVPEWVEMTDLMNIVGTTRTPIEWLQFFQKAMHRVRKGERYRMNWMERLLFDLHAQSRLIATTTAKSNDHMTCGDVFRTGGGELQIRCTLCGIMCESVVLFQQHIADLHSIDTERHVPSVEDKQMIRDLITDNAAAVPSNDAVTMAETIIPDTKETMFVSVHNAFEGVEWNPVACVMKEEPNMDNEASDDGTPMLNSVFIKEEPVWDDDDKSIVVDSAEALASSKETDKRPKKLRYECDYCKEKFSIKTEIFTHMKIHKPVKTVLECPSCDFNCTSMRTFGNHIKTHNLGKYTCAECGELSATRSDYLKHFRTAHMRPIDPDVASNFSLVEADGEHYACPSCAQTFNSTRELHAHRSVQHPKVVYRYDSDTGSVLEDRKSVTGGRHYRCNICQSVATSVCDMSKHMVIHSSVKPIMCSRCTFSCTRSANLTAHRIKEHNGGCMPEAALRQPLVCDMCGFRCKFKYYMIRHWRVHTGDRPFKCLEVGCVNVAFSAKKSLRNHFMAKHYVGPYAYKCRVCDGRFAREYTRTWHMRKEHPEVAIIAKHRRIQFE